MRIIEKIESAFKQSPNKNCLFLFDPLKEYSEDLKLLTQSITLIEVDQRYFDVKIKISEALKNPSNKLLLYHAFERPAKLSHYPLVGLLVSGIELRLDDVAQFLSEYDLPENKRDLSKKWIKYLTKTNKKKLAKVLNAADFTEDNLKRGMLCIAMDLNTVYDKDTVLMKFLATSQSSQDLTKIVSRIESLLIDETLYHWINEVFGLELSSLTYNDIRMIVNTIKYNVITANLGHVSEQDNYDQLKIHKPQVLNRLLNFYESWLDHPKYRAYIEPVFASYGSDIKEDNIFKVYGVDQKYGFLSTEGYNYIIKSYSEDIYKDLLTSSQSKNSKDNKTFIPFAKYKKFIEALSQQKLSVDKSSLDFLSYYLRLFESMYSIDLFVYNEVSHMLNDYCENQYVTDRYFRKVETAYKAFETSSDIADRLFSLAQAAYNEYLINYNSRFLELMHKIEFDYSKINFPKQYNFFNDNITDVKTAVIISDAFRYELCKELESELLKHDKNQIEVAGALASIPSFTQMGMTNLLPQKRTKLIGDTDIRFEIDGIETKSSNRKTIIEKNTSSGTGILFQDLMKLSKEKGRELFKAHKLVYIYHNHVDATSDKQELEDYTFKACDKAIIELERLTRTLYDWNVYHQYITADHGFLYNSLDLRDADKEKLPSNPIYADSRSCIVHSDAVHNAGYDFPLKNVTNLETDLQVVIPRAINRFRRQGKIGLKFVHGGASIQELVVPVLKYYKKNESVREAVDFQRIDRTNKLNSPTSKFTFLQTDYISNLIKPRRIVVALFSNDGRLASNEVELSLSVVDERPSERSFHFNLTLNSEANNESFVKLKAFDLDTDKNRLNPIIDDTLIVNLSVELDEF